MATVWLLDWGQMLLATGIMIGRALIPGLDAKDALLLGPALLAVVLIFGTGRTNILEGFVHLASSPPSYL